MKKLLIFFGVTGILNFACDRKDTPEEKYRSGFDSLKHELHARDSSVNELLLAFNEIEKNLDSIAEKQNLIVLDVSVKNGDLHADVKSRINKRIDAINWLLEKNKNKISELNRKLTGSRVEITEFNRMIDRLNEEVRQKNSELSALKNQLSLLHSQIRELQITADTLGIGNKRQAQQIAAQTEALRTAYYLVGESEELVKKKIIDKKGGLLGIGKTSKLNPEFDPAGFTKIDYTQVLSIPVFSKRARVVTVHPDGSYFIDKEGKEYTNLIILHPEKFWSANKFLVIVND